MEIHKPKPVHGWGEFLKEYAIIVLGMLTAPTLETTVENWREHRQYLESRDAIRYEIPKINFSNSRHMNTGQPYLQRPLDDISKAKYGAD